MPFKATIKKSPGLFRGRSPSRSSTMNILLYPLHTSALVCLLWLDGGHNDIHCKLAAQLTSCLRTTVITSIFLQVTFERTLLNNILHPVSCHITARTSSCLNISEQTVLNESTSTLAAEFTQQRAPTNNSRGALLRAFCTWQFGKRWIVSSL